MRPLLALAIFSLVWNEASSQCRYDDILKRVTDDSRLSRFTGICTTRADITTHDAAYIQQFNAASPSPINVDSPTTPLNTLLNQPFCIAATIDPQWDTGTESVLYFYSNLSPVGELTLTNDTIRFELQGAIFEHSGSFEGFQQIQLCVRQNSVDLYLDCQSTPVAHGSFVRNLAYWDSIKLITVFRQVFEGAGSPHYGGLTQQLYFIQCPALTDAQQRSIQCLDVPRDCSLSICNSETSGAMDVAQTVQRFFEGQLPLPRRMNAHSVFLSPFTCQREESEMNTDVISTSDNMELTLKSALNVEPPVFTLTCTSTSGPASTVLWTLNGDVINDDSNHEFSQSVTSQYSPAYSNTLTVTGRATGDYQCSVNNIMNAGNPAIQSLTVTAASPPTGLRVIKDGTSTITVSWTPPVSTPTGYVIYYQATDGGTDSGSVTVAGGSVDQFDITGRNCNSYDITIVATSDHLPSTVVGPVQIRSNEDRHTALFQLQVGPMERCTSWDFQRAEKVEEDVRKEIAKALEEACQCGFSPDHIKTGKISCWNTLADFTYRSTITGTASHNSAELLELLREWIWSEPVLQIHLFQVRVVSTCYPEISSLSDPECPASTDPSFPVSSSLSSSTCINTNHPLVMRCVHSCAKLQL